MAGVQRLLVHLLVMFLGIGSWITVNGIYVESPILTQLLPEGWKFTTYIIIVSQCANIGPVAIRLLKKYLYPNDVNVKGKMVCSQALKNVIHASMILGIVAAFVIIFVWDQTVIISNTPISLPFFILFFFMALVGCTGVVIFPIFVGSFKKPFLTSLILGESLSGLIPSVAALIQGVKNKECVNVTSDGKSYELISIVTEPQFSVSSFLTFTFVLLILSEISFTTLNFWHGAQREIEMVNQTLDSEANVRSLPRTKETSSLISKKEKPTAKETLTSKISTCLLLQQCWLAALSITILPSIQSYSTIPYSIKTFHLSAVLSNIFSPLSTCFAFYLNKLRPRTIAVLTGIISIIGSYIFAAAVLSPSPPLQEIAAGSVLMIIAWIVFSSLSSFVKVSIVNLLRHHEKSDLLAQWGFSVQLGSAIGAITVFILINYTTIFKSENSCA